MIAPIYREEIATWLELGAIPDDQATRQHVAVTVLPKLLAEIEDLLDRMTALAIEARGQAS